MSEKKKEVKHYVDNDKFYEAMVDYISGIEEDKAKPRASEYIGHCILQICKRLAFRPNFIAYPYRAEMISDAIENCVRYIDRFDYIKYKSPFAYFSQIAFYAMVRRIQSEHKQMQIKAKFVQTTGMYDDMVGKPEDDDTEYFNLDDNSTLKFLYDFEIKEPEKKKRKSANQKCPLDAFIK